MDSLNTLSLSNIFEKEKNHQHFKETCYRQELHLRAIFSEIDFPRLNSNISKVSLNSENSKFTLKLTNFKNIPKTPEYFYNNLTELKDEIYYLKTDDIFEYFYFFKSGGATGYNWFWSPAKKTDQEDVWIKVPSTKIPIGFWEGKPIPSYIEEFIRWLEIFNPGIPSVNIRKIIKEDSKISVTNHKELKVSMNMIEERMLNEDKCIIF